MILLLLFWEFFKAGLFAIGGGMATLPFLQTMSVKTGWFTLEELANMVAVSESTPGPIGVNMATYAGYNTAGIVGSLAATLGLITPSIIVILIISGILEKFRTNKNVDHAFYGIRPASTGLIASAVFSLIIMCVGREVTGGADYVSLFIIMGFYILTSLSVTKKVHPIVWIALSAVMGMLIF